MSMKWHNRFVAMAQLVATWSKDPSTQVGAVIVDNDKRIVSTGYNGAPRGVNDDSCDRDTRLLRTLHAEENAILFARRDLTGYYLYCTHPPCAHCAAVIVQAGIKAVYYPPVDVDAAFAERWQGSLSQGYKMFNEADVIYGAVY